MFEREREMEEAEEREKKVRASFDVAATNVPCDRRYMEAISELQQGLFHTRYLITLAGMLIGS